jgi:GAF domain
MSDPRAPANISGVQAAAAQPQKSPVAPLEKNESLSLLFDVSQELTAILERDELLQRIADRVRKLVDYHLFNVMLWNEPTAQLEGVFAKHYDEAIPAPRPVPLFQGITGHAAGHKCSLRVDDVRLDERYIAFPESDTVRSELVVPLMLRDRLVGVLDLESTNPAAFTPEHERMLGILGSYIAIALENSRLYQQTREREQRRQSDLDTAREVHIPKPTRSTGFICFGALFLFLYLIHFWWWEYRLQGVQQWTFPLYFFIAMYAVLLFLLCVLFFPEEMTDYDSFKTYFYSRRRWIFSLMTVLFVADLADTLIKGSTFLHALGPIYYFRTGIYILLCILATKIASERFHAGFAIFATAYEVLLILKYYMTVG